MVKAQHGTAIFIGLLAALADGVRERRVRATALLVLDVHLRELPEYVDARVEHPSGECLRGLLTALKLHFDCLKILRL